MNPSLNSLEELPLRSNTPLPFISLQRKVLPKPALIAVIVIMVSIAGTVLNLGNLRAVFLLLEFVAVIAIICIAVKSMKTRRKAHTELDEKMDALMTAIQARYAVITTDTIIYRLVEGGSTRLPDKDGKLTQMRLESDEKTQTTRLVVEQEW